MYYYGARYYNSDIGRFISTDPESRDYPIKFLPDPQQLNFYSYVTNNPLIYTDPTGKDLKSAFVGVFSFIGAAAYEFTDSMSYDLLPNINYGNANNATIAGGQAGNNLAQYINAGEMAIGAATIASSGPTMALAPVTGGTSSLVAGAEVAVGGALVAHGSGNLMKAVGKGNEIKNSGGSNKATHTDHSQQRMRERNINQADIDKTMSGGEKFKYYHDNQWKTGYYDDKSKIFVGKSKDGNITTTMRDVKSNYIKNLKSNKP